MPNKYVCTLAMAGVSLSSNLHAAAFADSIVNYSSGTGIQAGYDNASAALGEPSRVTPGQFGGAVDPFDPPYLSDQVVSIGAGGSLTLGFSTSVQNSASNPYGIDFTVFGNTGFQIVNGDFSGGGVTDGSLFGANAGPTRVSVSSDGQTFYELAPSLAPIIDGPFPTDGTGDFSKAIDPSLKTTSFTGKDLNGIRQLYAGSAGGAVYDISWARNASGQPATLDSIRFIRIDVLSGVSEIDGVAAVPEPTVLVLLSSGLLLFAFRRKQ